MDEPFLALMPLSNLTSRFSAFAHQRHQPPHTTGRQHDEHWLDGSAKTWYAVKCDTLDEGQRNHKVDKQQFAPAFSRHEEAERCQGKNNGCDDDHHVYNNMGCATGTEAVDRQVCFLRGDLPHIEGVESEHHGHLCQVVLYPLQGIIFVGIVACDFTRPCTVFWKLV